MSLEKFLHKAKKTLTPKSHTEKVLELRSQITELCSSLDILIAENTLLVREAKNEGKSYHRAENRIKNAYYTRMVLQSAMEDLEEVENDAQLAKVVNKAGRTILRLNSMADFSPKIGEKFLKWQADILGERNKENAVKEAIPTKETDEFTVPENLIDRLVSGETIKECLEQDRDFLEGEYTVSPAMAGELKDVDTKFNDLLKDLKQNV